jgi:uncharacterized protein with GYD domain
VWYYTFGEYDVVVLFEMAHRGQLNLAQQLDLVAK